MKINSLPVAIAAGLLRLALFAAIAIAAVPLPARAADVKVAAVEVKIDNFTFNPKQITAKVGDTVVWVNHDDIPHT